MIEVKSQGLTLRIGIQAALTMTVNDDYSELDSMVDSINENAPMKINTTVLIEDLNAALDSYFRVKSSINN